MIIDKNKIHKIDDELVLDAVSGKEIKERTKIYLQQTDYHLMVPFIYLDNPYAGKNTYSIDNSDQYKQEVFEIFIAQGINDPTFMHAGNEHIAPINLNFTEVDIWAICKWNSKYLSKNY